MDFPGKRREGCGREKSLDQNEVMVVFHSQFHNQEDKNDWKADWTILAHSTIELGGEEEIVDKSRCQHLKMLWSELEGER